jgi:DNA-binding transcriptional MerR regulator
VQDDLVHYICNGYQVFSGIAGIMPLTVSEIAEQTGHGASKASNKSFIERLHYWTRERLLLPIGKRNPGTGRRRLYPDTALHEALILNDMMEMGVPVEDQRRVMKVVHEWQRRMQPDLWLVIETYRGRSKPYFHEGPYTTHPDVRSAHVFNLTEIFSDLQDKHPAPRRAS